MSINDPLCPAWYRRYVEGKRVKVRKVRTGRGKRAGTLCSRDRRNRTGCVGISIVRTGGHRFFAAHAGGTNRKFNIDSLGKEEAWRRALRYRAEYERTLRRAA
jgi:hypothetical protein